MKFIAIQILAASLANATFSYGKAVMDMDIPDGVSLMTYGLNHQLYTSRLEKIETCGGEAYGSPIHHDEYEAHTTALPLLPVDEPLIAIAIATKDELANGNIGISGENDLSTIKNLSKGAQALIDEILGLDLTDDANASLTTTTTNNQSREHVVLTSIVRFRGYRASGLDVGKKKNTNNIGNIITARASSSRSIAKMKAGAPLFNKSHAGEAVLTTITDDIVGNDDESAGGIHHKRLIQDGIADIIDNPILTIEHQSGIEGNVSEDVIHLLQDKSGEQPPSLHNNGGEGYLILQDGSNCSNQLSVLSSINCNGSDTSHAIFSRLSVDTTNLRLLTKSKSLAQQIIGTGNNPNFNAYCNAVCVDQESSSGDNSPEDFGAIDIYYQNYNAEWNKDGLAVIFVMIIAGLYLSSSLYSSFVGWKAMLNKKLPKNGSTVLPNPFKGLVIFYKSHLLLSIMIVSLLMGSTTATNLCHPAWTGVGHRPSYNDAPASTISYESTITTNYCCREVNVDGGYDGCTMDAEGCTCTETKYTSCSNEGRFQTMEEKKKYNYICVSNYHCNDAQYKPDDDTQANWVAIAWKKDDEECTGEATLVPPVIWDITAVDGCPETYETALADESIDAGSIVTVKEGDFNIVYRCTSDASLSLLCSMLNFEPGYGESQSQFGHLHWTFLGQCLGDPGTLPIESYPNNEGLADVGGCPQEYVYVETQDNYKAGDRVSMHGLVYKCNDSMYNCGQAGNHPATQAGAMAWTKIGLCDGTINPTSSPSFDSLDDVNGCPDEWVVNTADHVYVQEDRVSGKAEVGQGGIYRLVYECKDWPYSEFCGQRGYEPEENDASPNAWKVAWHSVGYCTGTISPTPAPTFDTITFGCPDVYSSSADYDEGDMISMVISDDVGMMYECRPFPFEGWCALEGYEPGSDLGDTAWKKIGPCRPSEDFVITTLLTFDISSTRRLSSIRGRQLEEQALSTEVKDILQTILQEGLPTNVIVSISDTYIDDAGLLNVVVTTTLVVECVGCEANEFSEAESTSFNNANSHFQDLISNNTIISDLQTNLQTDLNENPDMDCGIPCEDLQSIEGQDIELVVSVVCAQEENENVLCPIPASTGSPSSNPTIGPSKEPSSSPSQSPSRNPSLAPSRAPTTIPTTNPTTNPTQNPSQSPSSSPSAPVPIPPPVPEPGDTREPTTSPSNAPSLAPTSNPSRFPSASPSQVPTSSPSSSPSKQPSNVPSASPSSSPSQAPTGSPSKAPSSSPSQSPSRNPSIPPSKAPIPYVVVESLTNEWGSLGQYFVFDPSVWVANFGSFTNLRSVANNVKVCRSGVEIWTGDITAFALTAFADNNIGRREPDSAAGDWEVNDVIVPPSTSCPATTNSIVGYTHFSTGGCSGRNELGATTGGSVQECADSCTNDSTCVSFEYGKTDDPSDSSWYTKCTRSTSCNDYSLTVQNPSDPAHFYLKNMEPSSSPSQSPSGNPSQSPSANPSPVPTSSPSANPSPVPSKAPSASPSKAPSKAPSQSPSLSPPKSYGGTCTSNDRCQSGYCVSNKCRDCPTSGQTTGCASGQFCLTSGSSVLQCTSKRNNGSTCSNNNFCHSGVCTGGVCKGGNGGTCSSNNGCQSGYCVSGKCRECPTSGQTTGCASGQFCLTSGSSVLQCTSKRNNGSTCSNNNYCNSSVCVSGKCRVCFTNSHCTNKFGSNYKCYNHITRVKHCCKGQAPFLNSCKW